MQTCSGTREEAGFMAAGSPLSAIRREFERQLGLERTADFAAMTVTELPDRWMVVVDLPGVAESDVNVTFEDGTLTIEGERKSAAIEGGKGLFNDRSFGKFRRVLNVRDAIDQDGIDAELKDGVLTLTLHRSPETAPRKISIRSASTIR